MSATLPSLKSGAGKRLPKLSAGKPSSGSKTTKSPKKPKTLPTLVAVKPLNIEVEKKRFFDSGGKYNPQFMYSVEVDSKTLLQYGEPSSDYLAQVLWAKGCTRPC